MKMYFITQSGNVITPLMKWNNNITPDPSWILGNAEEPFYEEHGISLWKYENGECKRRTTEEIQADVDAIPPVEPTEEEILRADVDYLLMLQE